MNLRTPLITFERVKISLALVIYAVGAERVDPRPFFGTSFSKWLLVLLFLEVARQVLTWRLEVSHEAVLVHAGLKGRWRLFRSRFTTDARYRMRRAITILGGLYVLGWAIDLMTTRCSGALQCAWLFPRLAIENLPFALQMMFVMSMGLLQLGGMFYAMTKVGFIKIVLPGTVDVTFDDIYGQDKAVEKMKEQVSLLEDDEVITRAGGYMPKGVLLYGPPGTGKRLAGSQLVLTPDGYRTARTIRPGDQVYGPDGLPTAVEAIFPSEVKPIYKVTFSDGATSRVDGDHLWGVYDREATIAGKYTIRTTDFLRARLRTGDHWRFQIPLTKSIEFPEQTLPLDPYLMGALLGDGSFRHNLRFATADRPIVKWIASLLPQGDYLMPVGDGISFNINGGTTRTIIRDVDLWMTSSHTKFVPTQYLWNTAKNRLSLLRGLMDTDGSIDKRGLVTFSSASLELREAMRFLVESFGGFVVSERPKIGESKEMLLKTFVNPFRLSRKAKRWKLPRYNVSRRVIAVESAGKEDGVCLKIAHPRGLFLLDRFVVTHNTMLAKAAANASTKPLILVPPGAFVSTFMGINFLKVGMFFRTLRKYSLRYKGAYGFIDEIDSLGNRGMTVPQSVTAEPPSELGLPAACTTLPSSEAAAVEENTELSRFAALLHRMFIGGGADSGTINAFLAAMDGMEEPRGLINRLLRVLSLKPLAPPKYKYMLVGATNLLAKVDVALLRAGRFDRKILVTHPKYEGRKATYDGYLGKVTHNLSDADVAWAARNHHKGTGAEIRDIVNEALLVTFRDGRPGDEAGIVTKLDLMNAMLWKKAGESDGLFEVKYHQWSTAIHESGHAVVQHHLRSKRERIWIASIEQRGSTGGVVWPVPLDDDWHMDKSDMEADVMVSLGSRVSEYLFFGEMSNGHAGDGPAATRNVEQMVLLGHTFNWRFRKDRKKGRIAYTWARRSDEFQDEVEDLLFELLRRTKKLLEPRKDQVEAVAKLLMEKHTVAGEEIHDLLTEMEEAR